MRWHPFVYQYGIQAVMFGIGIFLALKSGQFRLSEKRGKIYLGMMIATFFVYFLLQGFMQFFLPEI